MSFIVFKVMLFPLRTREILRFYDLLSSASREARGRLQKKLMEIRRAAAAERRKKHNTRDSVYLGTFDYKLFSNIFTYIISNYF